MPCLLRDGACDPTNPCVAHDRWSDLARQFLGYFQGTTVESLVKAGPTT